MDRLRQGGVSTACTVAMKDFIGTAKKLNIKEWEYAILSIMCLLSPDRGNNIGERDRQQLVATQVLP